MILLFPSEPFASRRIDPDFVAEYEAARRAGFECFAYSHDDAESGDFAVALRPLPSATDERRLLTRGWMLPGDAYAGLHAALCEKGYTPLTAPADYDQAHYLPLAYAITTGHTARSAWIEGDDEESAWQLYENFSNRDAIIKDWVKSTKSLWKEACFIPASTDLDRFGEIFRAFREERGKLFNRGVVIREFLPLVTRGGDLGGLPLIEEFRLFFWRGELLLRPATSKSPDPLEDLELWTSLAKRFSSPFVTIDIALLEDGTWKIVETGDGQVSGPPMGMEPDLFYAALRNKSL